MKARIHLFYFLLAFVLSAGCKGKVECPTNDFSAIEKLYSVPIGGKSDEEFVHYVLMRGLELPCADSNLVMRAVEDYLFSARSERPVYYIDLFSSKEGYDAGETLSQPEEFYDHRVLTIYFDEITQKPTSFIFYKDGKIIHKGNTWRRE